MKKFLVLSMLIFGVISLIGCNDISSTQTTGTSTQTTETTQPSTTDNDPVILGAEDITIEKNSTFIPLDGVTATDVEDGELTSLIQTSGNVNPMAVGDYTQTYTVTDSDGNIATVVRNVIVTFTDVSEPLIVGTGNTTIFVGADFNPLEGVSATDAVDGSVAVTHTGTVDVWTVGDYTLNYSAQDESNNVANVARTVTVSYGDFVFSNPTEYDLADFTVTEGLYQTPAFSGGVINDTIADFTYVRFTVNVAASAAGTINLSFNNLSGSMSSFDVTGGDDTFEVVYVISQAVTDVTFDVDSNGTDITNLNVAVEFAEIRDLVAPELVVPSSQVAYVVDQTEASLLEYLMMHVTSVDDVDGNITDDIDIDLGILDVNAVGVYNVIYSSVDQEGNESTYTREVIIGYSVDSGIITDPSYQNSGDGQWEEKSSGGGDADIAYDSTEETMAITINNLGTYPSAAGAYLKADSGDFVVGQWYVFTFTAKTTIARDMPIRMGLVTDQANGWVDDYNGRTDTFAELTNEFVTYSYYFKLDTLVSSGGYEEFIIELNLGMDTGWSNVGTGGVTTFKNMTINKVVTSFEAPTYTINQAANLPTKFTEGDSEPVWNDYVTFFNMSGEVVTPIINATQVDLTTAGTYNVVYTATDANNMTTVYSLPIEVFTEANADETAPVVTLKDGVPTSIDQFTSLTVNLHDLVVATDAVDGDITVKASMIDDGGLNTDVAGVYTVTCTVYDASGNIAVFTADITVVDKEAPVIVINDTDLSVGDEYDPTTILVVNDNVDGVIDNSNVTITGLDAFVSEGIVSTVGTFVVNFVVSDALGNQATKAIIVNVSNVEWDELSREPFGTPNEGPTHSTVTYDPVADETVITDIDPNTDSWDHARWVYYLADGTDLVAGRTYKIEITVKADQATNLYFRIGSTLGFEPWIDNFDGGLRTISISENYATYSIIFTVDKAMPYGNAKFQFMYGYEQADATNTIYIKSFDLVQEQVQEFVTIDDMYSPDETAHSTVAVDLNEEAFVISDMEQMVYDWDTGRLVYYLDNTVLEDGKTYRIQFTAKADVATEIRLRIGSTLAAEPWIDNFDGGLKTVNVGTEYATYELVFTVDKAMSFGNAKFQFMFGYLATDAGNSISITDFNLQAEGPVYSEVQNMYTANETAHSTVVYDQVNDVLDITDMESAVYDWDTGRLVYYLDNQTLLSGQVYRIVFTVKADVATDIKLRIGSTLAAAPWIDNFIGGVKTVNVGTEYATYELLFKVNKTMPYGNAKFQFMYGYLATDAGNALHIKDFYLEEQNKEADTLVQTLDDMLYVDEAAFGDVWNVKVNNAVSAADESEVLDLNSFYDSMVLTLPGTESSWTYIRANNSLSSFGATDDAKYLAYYVTNNTDQTQVVAWLFWNGSQMPITVDLPAIGESGWVIIKIADTGHTVSEIINFGLGFDNASWSPCTGSLTVYKIVAVEHLMALKDIEVTIAPTYQVIEDFEGYTDDADLKANWASLIGLRTSGGAWNTSNGTLVTNGEQNSLEIVLGAGTNGIKVSIDKAALEAAGAEYYGFFVKTSVVLSGSLFQGFYYNPSGYHQIDNIYGDISKTNEGTYVLIKLADLPNDVTAISLMINAGSGNSGVLLLDNFVAVSGLEGSITLIPAPVFPEEIIIEDFEGFADDADMKANWTMLNALRTSGGGWSANSGALVDNAGDNAIEIAIGAGTNGIKLNINKGDLEALGAEFFGFNVQTTNELVGSPVFQAFYYTASGFTQINTIIGDITETANGTYVWITLDELPSDVVSVSILLNVSAENTGTLTIDNIAVK